MGPGYGNRNSERSGYSPERPRPHRRSRNPRFNPGYAYALLVNEQRYTRDLQEQLRQMEQNLDDEKEIRIEAEEKQNDLEEKLENLQRQLLEEQNSKAKLQGDVDKLKNFERSLKQQLYDEREIRKNMETKLKKSEFSCDCNSKILGIDVFSPEEMRYEAYVANLAFEKEIDLRASYNHIFRKAKHEINELNLKFKAEQKMRMDLEQKLRKEQKLKVIYREGMEDIIQQIGTEKRLQLVTTSKMGDMKMQLENEQMLKVESVEKFQKSTEEIDNLLDKVIKMHKEETGTTINVPK